VQTSDGITFAEELEAVRQMRDVDLEASQSVWQWLIASALALLIVETILAGRRSVYRSSDQSAASTASA
jgi:hypothetical protein